MAKGRDEQIVDRVKGIVTATLVTICILIPAVVEAQTDDMNADEAALFYAKQVPGYGGTYYDSEGVAHVYVTDMSASRHAAHMLNVDGEIKFERGKFAFDELYAYRQRMVDVMSDPNSVYLDIDERSNRVTVGVSKEARVSRTSVDLARHFNVPPEAVVVKKVEPIRQLVDLDDRVRPAPGGVQIRNPNHACSLGFIVRRRNTQGQTTHGFVTASHCTSTQGGVENTRFWQATRGALNAIGTEIRDPVYLFGGAGCPAGRRCRDSDSALVQLSNNNAALGQFGSIARPTCANCNNTLTIDNGGNRRFQIRRRGSAGIGVRLHKVGKTTGWTYGNHSRTCVDAAVNGTNITLSCQGMFTATCTHGDSGAPVFQRLGGNRVKLVGLAWGGNANGCMYSPIVQIRLELGSFSVR